MDEQQDPIVQYGLPQCLSGKESACNAGDKEEVGSIPGSVRSSGGGNGNPLQCFCLKKSHGQRNLAGYSPKGWKDSEVDVTEGLSVHCIAEGAIFSIL